MSATTTPTGSSGIQGPLWGARAADWAELQEPLSEPLFRRLVALAKIGRGTRVLDAGCASGYFARLAVGAGAEVTGLDASETLLAIARERAPESEFVQGDLESLPFADDSFDVVSGFNSFQYAASPVAAVAEARRVARSGGIVAAAVWAEEERCEAASYVAAIGSLLPPPPPGAPGPFALSAPGALEGLLAKAGLDSFRAEEVVCVWSYPDEETAVRALGSAGPAVRAIEQAGESALVDVLRNALAPYRRDNGGYYLENAFRLVLARA
jgi:SAM-dependent methyltransferase